MINLKSSRFSLHVSTFGTMFMKSDLWYSGIRNDLILFDFIGQCMHVCKTLFQYAIFVNYMARNH